MISDPRFFSCLPLLANFGYEGGSVYSSPFFRLLNPGSSSRASAPCPDPFAPLFLALSEHCKISPLSLVFIKKTSHLIEILHHPGFDTFFHHLVSEQLKWLGINLAIFWHFFHRQCPQLRWKYASIKKGGRWLRFGRPFPLSPSAYFLLCPVCVAWCLSGCLSLLTSHQCPCCAAYSLGSTPYCFWKHFEKYDGELKPTI